jgi:hypothetical protein
MTSRTWFGTEIAIVCAAIGVGIGIAFLVGWHVVPWILSIRW